MQRLEYQRQQNIQPVCCNASAEAAYGVRPNGLADELAVAKTVEHGGMGAEETAPAHADGREHSDGVVIDDALGDETWHQTDGGTYGTKSGHGEGNQSAVLEAEEPFKDDVDLVGCPADDRYAFVGDAEIFAIVACRTKGKHHHDGGDAEHTRDDGKADADAVFATVEQRVEKTHEYAAFAFEGDLLLVAAKFCVNGSVQLGVCPQRGALHQSCGDDTTDDGTRYANQSTFTEAKTCHEGHHHQTHSEGSTEIGQRDELVLLEIAVEVLVVCQGDDGWVVAEESHHSAQGSYAREVIKRLHQRTQQVLQQTHYAKLGEKFADGTHEHTDGHDVEHGLEQQVISRLHEGVQHFRQAHLIGQQPKESEEDNEKDDGFNASFGGELHWVLSLELFEEPLHPIMIERGGSFDGVVFCLCHNGLFFQVKQVDFPGEAKVGLELADAVYARV